MKRLVLRFRTEENEACGGREYRVRQFGNGTDKLRGNKDGLCLVRDNIKLFFAGVFDFFKADQGDLLWQGGFVCAGKKMFYTVL